MAEIDQLVSDVRFSTRFGAILSSIGFLFQTCFTAWFYFKYLRYIKQNGFYIICLVTIQASMLVALINLFHNSFWAEKPIPTRKELLRPEVQDRLIQVGISYFRFEVVATTTGLFCLAMFEFYFIAKYYSLALSLESLVL
jgi:hypothetical protein